MVFGVIKFGVGFRIKILNFVENLVGRSHSPNLFSCLQIYPQNLHHPAFIIAPQFAFK